MKKAQAAIQLLRRSRRIWASKVDPADGRGEPDRLNRTPRARSGPRGRARVRGLVGIKDDDPLDDPEAEGEDRQFPEGW